MVDAAIERGHEVTLFNRGKTGPGTVADAEEVHGDRDGGLDALDGRGFDRVIDVSGYAPRIVRESARLLADSTDHYTFISTISVYGDFSKPDVNEDAPLATTPDESDEEIADDTYGPLKALCENAVHEIYGDRATVIRPGFVVGPFDYTDRFPYWCLRPARGGEMVAPDDPHRPIQFVDGRDLANFTVGVSESSTHGYFNVTGPADPLTWGRFIDECLAADDGDTKPEWLPEAFLRDQGVDLGSELPLYAPEDIPGAATVDCGRAIAAGLQFRTLGSTIEDTLAWVRPGKRELTVGMTAEREAEILGAWWRSEKYGS